ncbi:MAG: hypothetical protein V2J19_05595 [Wenzhouxiangella sp.]|jgi:hypothetical protein|nr:hypothetical protein [Wenzhouxiangella sp.]
MSTSVILVSTVLVVLLVLAIALLTGSLALLAGVEGGHERRGGLTAALRLLDRQWQIERLVYRHHRIFGLLVIAAGSFCLWRLTRTELTAVLDGRSSASILLWVLLAGQAFNLLVGLVVFFRPSLLKPLETISNRWHEWDVSGECRPSKVRLTAILLALVGLAVLFASATLLLQQMAPVLG